MQLLERREHIAPERILVEPCAEHTHRNLGNSGRWMHAMGARAASAAPGVSSTEYFYDKFTRTAL